MPLTRRVPKRGFHNPFRTVYTPVNLDNLGVFETGQEVSPELLREKGLGRQGVGEDTGQGGAGQAAYGKGPRLLPRREGKDRGGGRPGRSLVPCLRVFKALAASPS